MKIQYLILFFLLLISACSKTSKIDQSLALSGNNQAELETVLKHYSNAQDLLKLKAAKFLIENMIYKYSLDSESMSSNQPYYDALEDYRIKKGRYGEEGLYIVCDSVRDNYSDQIKPTPTYSSDLTRISAQFLINHIDRSFDAWKRHPWAKDIDFDLFCNYILPYKSGNTYWEDAYPYFENFYNKLTESLPCKTKAKMSEYIEANIKGDYTADGTFFREFYPFLTPMSIQNAIKTKLGECYDINCICVTALRSMSVPAVINMVPLWGNSNDRHFWTEIIGDTVKALYNNTQIKYTNTLEETVNDMFWFKYSFSDSDTISSKISIQNCRTIPKVFRDCYAIQESGLFYNATEEIPPFFKNPGLKDITSHYIQSTNINVDLWNIKTNSKYAYLCCYSPNEQGWTPVAWGKTKRNKVTFKDMGVNILYLPAYYMEGKIVPAGIPFILTENGDARLLTGNLSPHQDIILYNKVPYRGHTLYYAKNMVGCKFQTANKADMSDTTTIYEIDKIPFYEQNIEIKQTMPSRYAIYKFDREMHRFIAELEFWGKDDNGVDVKLTGKMIGNRGFHQYNREKAIDGDRVSYFFSIPQEETYIGFDFGKPYRINRIKFSPRSDDNGIVSGELYELFYWKGGWISLGKQVGREDHTLIYKNIPKDALLRIHNHTRGKEHRPFTYENGKQIWL